MAEAPTSGDAAACSTEFFSAHVESLSEALSTVDVDDKEARVEAEIEASKVHWSELTSAYVPAGEVGAVESTSTSTSEWKERSEVETTKEWNERVAKDNVEVFRTSTSTSEWKERSEVETTEEWNERVAKDNVEVFWSLQERYPGGFFVDDNNVGPDHVQELPSWMRDEDGKFVAGEVKLSSEKPFAEGAQAQLFHAHLVYPDGERDEEWVMKVFKEGTSLRDLQRLLPPSMLNGKEVQEQGFLYIGGCNEIGGARLLKGDGRFAFLMLRAWGDLRKLIDTRMLRNNNQGAPFSEEVASWCMFCVAKGMQNLHAKGIVHRDLKAANVLVFNDPSKSNGADVDPFLLRVVELVCLVADFECSVGVVGTRFWRAPEILLALKNRNFREHPAIFSKQGDVYSFGMTCYEILTGGIPLEELEIYDYDGAIGGARPILPRETPPWMVDVVERCWHQDPSMRPTFDEVMDIMRDNCKDFEMIWNETIL